eukprot:jgi/Ulvmu1/10313/UM060_0115.1
MSEQTHSQYPLVSVADAQEVVERESVTLPAEEVDLKQVAGRVLAETVTAKDDLPPFPASIKDGYAVVAADGTGTFPVVGAARAGAVGLEVKAGSAAYITTGAPLPQGADAVVQVEDTEPMPDSGEVKIKVAATAGQDIRTVGSDVQTGQVCLEDGELIGPAEVGILATVGAVKVNVHRQPKVAVLSTGDELVEAEAGPLGPGQIRDSNRRMLLAAVAAAGYPVMDLGIAGDEEGKLDGTVRKALDAGADVIITSGGVSMGDTDLVKPLLERLGIVHFGRVLMKPGKPLTFATLKAPDDGRRVLFFGLPGNPVSTLVCFHLFVRPCLHKLSGRRDAPLAHVRARTPAALRLDRERPEFHRVTLEWDGEAFTAQSTGGQRSSRLLSLRSATGLLCLPQGTDAQPEIPAGAFVPCILLSTGRVF